MKKRRLLFVAPFPTKTMNFDGERNKSRDVYLAILKTGNYKISIINLSKNQFFQILKMIIIAIFHRYDVAFVCKCIVGGSLALHILNKLTKKKPKHFYIVGNGYEGFDDKKIYFDDINKCSSLIVESNNVKEAMILKGFDAKKIFIFPCLKPKYDLKCVEHNYIKGQPLKLIFFSRINPEKGLGDLIEVINDINSRYQEPVLYLDVSGGVSNEPGIKEFNEYVISECEKHEYLNYLGMNLRIDGIESYRKLQQYDLHVFPSRFTQECAPGSILDMFVAGVPTLSSKYPSYKDLLSENNSFFFEQGNKNDLKQQLIFIYENSVSELNKRRFSSFDERLKYTDDKFILLIREIGV